MFDAEPDGWREVRLDDVASINPESLGQRTDPAFSFGYIDISQIEQPGVCAGWTSTTFAAAPSRARRTVREGDIIVSTVRPYLRAFAKVPKSDEPLVASTGFAVIRANREADQDFLFQHIMAEGFVEHLKPRMTGSNYPAVSADDVSDYRFQLPPLDEQRRIAEVLRSIDKAVASADVVVQRADRSLKLLAEQFLVAEAEAIGSEVRLGDLLASIDAGVSVNSEGRLAEDGELGILKTSCVSAARFDPAEHKAVLKSERKRVRVPVTAESIILSRMNTLDLVGANAFVADDHLNLYLPDRLWLLKTNPNVRCRWLAYYMKTARFRGQIVDIASGTSGSMKNISKSRFAELPIYIPSIELQDAAVEVLTSVEQAAFRAAGALESNKRVKASLSGDLLSGRVRVPA